MRRIDKAKVQYRKDKADPSADKGARVLKVAQKVARNKVDAANDSI